MPDDMCPHCRGTGFVTSPQSLALAMLRGHVQAANIVTLPGERVREEVAARLLNRSASTLRDWRKGLQHDEAPLPYRRDPGGRITYFLADIANWLAKSGG